MHWLVPWLLIELHLHFGVIIVDRIAFAICYQDCSPCCIFKSGTMIVGRYIFTIWCMDFWPCHIWCHNCWPSCIGNRVLWLLAVCYLQSGCMIVGCVAFAIWCHDCRLGRKTSWSTIFFYSIRHTIKASKSTQGKQLLNEFNLWTRGAS